MKIHTSYEGFLPITHSQGQWSDERFYLSRLTITFLSSSKSGVSMFVVAATYWKEIRMKYWYCSWGPRRCLFQHVVHVTLPTTAPINASLTNLPQSRNHIFQPLKGICSPWTSQWPSPGSHLQPFHIAWHIQSTLYSQTESRMSYISTLHSHLSRVLLIYSTRERESESVSGKAAHLTALTQ